MKRFSAVIALSLALILTLSGCRILSRVVAGVRTELRHSSAAPAEPTLEETAEPTSSPEATSEPEPTTEPEPTPAETAAPQTTASGLSGNREDLTESELLDFFVRVVFGTNRDNKVIKWMDPIVVSVKGGTKADAEQITNILDTLNQYEGFPGVVAREAAGADANVNIEYKFVTDAQLKAAEPDWNGTNTCYVSYQYDNNELYHSVIYLVSDWEKSQSARNFLLTWATFFSIGLFNDTDMYYDSIYSPSYYDEQLDKTFTSPVRADWYLVSMLYDSRVKPGMTPDEAVAALSK